MKKILSSLKHLYMTQKKAFDLSIIFLCTLGIVFYLSKPQPYRSMNSRVTLFVPAWSLLTEECCMYNAQFINFKKPSTLKKELALIFNTYYEPFQCHDKTLLQ